MGKKIEKDDFFDLNSIFLTRKFPQNTLKNLNKSRNGLKNQKSTLNYKTFRAQIHHFRQGKG
jgi:hypothetical protein